MKFPICDGIADAIETNSDNAYIFSAPETF